MASNGVALNQREYGLLCYILLSRALGCYRLMHWRQSTENRKTADHPSVLLNSFGKNEPQNIWYKPGLSSVFSSGTFFPSLPGD